MSTAHEPTPAHDVAQDALEQLPDSANELTTLSRRTWWPEISLEWVAGLLIIILTLFVTVTVIMRFAGSGVLGAVELSALAMVIVTVLVIPAATAADDNFKVEIVDMFNRPGLVKNTRILGAVVQLIVSLFLAFSSLELFIYDWSTKTTMAGELSIPRYWMSLVIFVSFAVLVHAASLFLFRLMRSRRKTDNEGYTDDQGRTSTRKSEA